MGVPPWCCDQLVMLGGIVSASSRCKCFLILSFFPFSQLFDLRNAFISTVKEFLTSRWKSEIEESWVLLFDFMAGIMMTGYTHKYWDACAVKLYVYSPVVLQGFHDFTSTKNKLYVKQTPQTISRWNNLYDIVTSPYYPFSLQVVVNGGLPKKYQTFSSNSSRGRLREVVAYKRF